jgi:uncharacterized membrane protein (UPF0182 family)
VKVVVDAYNGTVTFYVVDPSDPLIRVWQNAFPHLFTPVSKAPADLVAHFRYPEDYLQAQATQLGRYHQTDVPTFFANNKQWTVPTALSSGPTGGGTGNLRPYYVLFKLPGDTQEQFVLLEPFVPAGRQNMVAYVTAGSDSAHYGQLNLFQFPSGENVDGPQQVRSLINQDPTASAQITLLNSQGSGVQFGDLVIVPIENSFLYVQPIFLISSGATPIPELKRVVVVHGGSATIADSLTNALAASFGQAPPSQGGGQPPPGSQVGQLLQEALRHFQAAEAALKQGDLATYQREINAAQLLVQQANDLAAKTAGATPSPSPSP